MFARWCFTLAASLCLLAATNSQLVVNNKQESGFLGWSLFLNSSFKDFAGQVQTFQSLYDGKEGCIIPLFFKPQNDYHDNNQIRSADFNSISASNSNLYYFIWFSWYDIVLLLVQIVFSFSHGVTTYTLAWWCGRLWPDKNLFYFSSLYIEIIIRETKAIFHFRRIAASPTHLKITRIQFFRML